MHAEFSLDGFQTVHLNTASMLHEWRIVHGLTQSQVAEKAGITQQQYQYFESGKRDLRRSSFTTACKVLEALNMDIVKFFHGEYVFGAEIYADDDGQIRYKENGRPLGEEPGESKPNWQK